MGHAHPIATCAPYPLPVEETQEAVDLACDANGRLFLLTRPDNLVRVLTPEARQVTAFAGAGEAPHQLVNPTSITVDQRGRILITDTDRRTNRHRVKIFRYSALRGTAELLKDVPAWLDPIQVCVNSRGHLVTLGSHWATMKTGARYASSTERGDRVAHTGLFSLGGMSRAGAIALLPDDRVVLADEANDRVVILPPDLSEPDPVVTLRSRRGAHPLALPFPCDRSHCLVWHG
jgi:hypothetical protein